MDVHDVALLEARLLPGYFAILASLAAKQVPQTRLSAHLLDSRCEDSRGSMHPTGMQNKPSHRLPSQGVVLGRCQLPGTISRPLAILAICNSLWLDHDPETASDSNCSKTRTVCKICPSKTEVLRTLDQLSVGPFSTVDHLYSQPK